MLARARLLTVAAVVTMAPAVAWAEPLDIAGINDLTTYVECAEDCEAGPDVDYWLCLEDCGDTDADWEKDGVVGINRNDLDLAVLETADDGRGTEICYRDDGRIVVPVALCPGAACEAIEDCSDEDCQAEGDDRPPACLDVVCAAELVRDEDNCADGGRGIPQWLEDHLADGGGAAGAFCADDVGCGFHSECTYRDDIGSALCEFRQCGQDAEGAALVCPAFHLEVVAQDDRQVLVHVYFDYSPVPPTVLDLHIAYDQRQLLLQDARPLPTLTHFGKELSSTHRSDGVLRLVVYDSTSEAPIRQGPLVELVFQRLGDGATTIEFARSDELQSAAIAPLQGDEDSQNELQDYALWGPPIDLPSRAELERLLLWYAFESESDPLDYSNIPDDEALCGRVAECSQEPDEQERAKALARLQSLQNGVVSFSERIDGITRSGAWLDGAHDHLQLPVHPLDPLTASGQSFSLSTWFYSDGPSADEDPAGGQVVYSHNAVDERTRFGLILRPAADEEADDGEQDLIFFVGDLLNPGGLRPIPVATNIPLRTWHNVGFSLDADPDVRTVVLYFDGQPTATYQFPTSPPPISCPGFVAGSDVVLHKEGEFLGGQVPEALYFSPAKSNLNKIMRMDAAGLSNRMIIGDGRSSHRDPDYLPILDKLVYSSNATGNFEIWLANGDGSGRQQLTVDFGDTGRGIFAKRPRWAPDGTGIVFESNVYDVGADHNTARTYQLYYLGYDAASNEPRISLEGGGTADKLEYLDRIADQTIGAHQLTRTPHNHQRAVWLSGRGADGVRGDIVFGQSSERFKDNVVRRMTIPANVRNAESARLDGLGGGSDEIRFLTAYRRVKAGADPPEVAYVLYDKGTVGYGLADDFRANAVDGEDDAVVTVRHVPGDDPFQCWDANRNHLDGVQDGRDRDEDRNRDNEWNEADCYPPEVRNLYISFDSTRYRPDLAGVRKAAQLLPEDDGGVHKELQLTVIETEGGSYLRVEVTSPYNALPLLAGDLATITFDRVNIGPPNTEFEAIQRNSDSQLFIDDLANDEPPWEFPLDGLLESVEDAAFSPDGTRLILNGVTKARPVLLRTRDIQSASGGERIVLAPARIKGLDWVAEQRWYPCNWIGGFQHPVTKRIQWGLRGGLDDLKLFSGVRDADAFLSEAARGLERLDVEGRDGPVGSKLPSCDVSHSECPPFHLCVQGRCEMVECDPEEPYDCTEAGGRCTLRPPAVEQEYEGDDGFAWVCAADCAVDAQCFVEDCLNGPCRYCDEGTLTCIECRDAVRDFGAFQIAGIEGCPDRNSFSCEEGACRTECYAFDDGQSIYLCDPTLEYCKQGRCALLDWDWTDLAPSSFGGLSETIFDDIPDHRRTVAIGEMTPISIKAYGVGDYMHPPELLVEGQMVGDNNALYGGDWFRIGRVVVHNQTRQEADQHVYALHSPHPISDLRVRLIVPPYENMNAAATGLGARNAEFCINDAIRTAEAAGEIPDISPCYRRGPGSDLNVGYRMGIPGFEAAEACRAAGHAACPPTGDPLRPYILGGHSSVLLLEATVSGAAAVIQSNRICSYEGGLVPMDGDTGRRRKLYFGDIQREQTAQQRRYCENNPEACEEATDLLDFTVVSGGAYGLLNCPFINPDNPVETAGVDFNVPQIPQALEQGAISELGNACRVELDAVRQELCYEFIGGDVSLDHVGSEIEIFRNLEFTLSRGFGHDRGFVSDPLPSFPLSVEIEGYSGGGLELTNRGDILSVDQAADPDNPVFPDEYKLGRRYDIEIARQPVNEDDPRFCVIDPETAQGAMADGGSTVRVVCGELHRLAGRLEGLVRDRVILEARVSAYVSAGRRRAGATFELGRGDNGEFEFPLRMLEGDEFSVLVDSHPRVPTQFCTLENAFGSVGDDDTEIEVRCEEVRPRVAGGVVEGYDGEGLVLHHSATGERLAIGGDGPFAFATQVQPGDRYQISVANQPAFPSQTCHVAGGSEGGGRGVMPNRDLFEFEVICADDPTYGVHFEVVGLAGRGLQVALNGREIRDVDQDGPQVFDTRLLDGAAWEITVPTQPGQPRQDCSPVPASGTIEGEDALHTRVICGLPVNDETYTVGGTVSGLAGSGFRLKLNHGTEKLPIDDDGAFTFDSLLQEGHDYLVEVDTQPSDPPQACSVANGSGRITDHNVDDIEVTCEGAAYVTVDFAAGAGDEVHFKAVLVDSHGVKVGETDVDATLPPGGAEIQIVDVGQGSAGSPRRAALTSGDYTLYAWLNSDNSLDGGKPTYEAGDLALRTTVTVEEGADHFEALSINDFAAGVGQEVTLSGAGIADDASVVCWWSHPVGGDRPDLPLADAIAVVGRSSVACPAAAAPCFEDGEGTTNSHDPLASGTYDVTCWLDRGGRNPVADNILDGEDLVGFAASVNADGQDPIAIELVVP